jgi:hypothetical protein
VTFRLVAIIAIICNVPASRFFGVEIFRTLVYIFWKFMTVETFFFITTALCLIQISKLNYVLNCERTELNKLVRINILSLKKRFLLY